MERKKENQRLLDEETARIKGKSQKESQAGGKVTRAQIEEALQNEQHQAEQEQLKPKGNVQAEDYSDFGILAKGCLISTNNTFNFYLPSLSKHIFVPPEKSHLETPLEENVNRIIPEEGTVEARTIEDAIAVLR